MSQTNNKKLTPDEQKKQTLKGIFGLIKIVIGAVLIYIAVTSMLAYQEDMKEIEELDKAIAVEQQNFIDRGCVYQGDHLWSCPR